MWQAHKSAIGSWGRHLQRLFVTPMELECKRCRHKWNYQGNKQPTASFPLYVSCPRCRTVVKLPVPPSSAPGEIQ